MSEMVRQRGIIRKLSNQNNLMEVFQKLVTEGKLTESDGEIYQGELEWINNRDYEIINGCLFDVSDARQEYDSEDYVEEVEKLNDTDYKIHLYWYNGGDSPISEGIERADKEYDKKPTVFYAVKLGEGKYMTRKGSAAPALFTHETRANAMVRLSRPSILSNGYKVVRFGEIK